MYNSPVYCNFPETRYYEAVLSAEQTGSAYETTEYRSVEVFQTCVPCL